ncbi:Ent-copalyl diphosphate synthase, chloroplastic-like protein [Tanacetum coccineum]
MAVDAIRPSDGLYGGWETHFDAVPHTYPIDMFEHIWMVDRLQRLRIARYFRPEIKNCVKYIYRYWNEKGIGYARNTNVPDVDDTAMGFRVLRMHGYQISTDVFRHFEKDGKFACYAGQLAESLTAMLSVYRASQMLFPGEKILDDANKFSHKFLTDKRSRNELLDKWVISKDLPGEGSSYKNLLWSYYEAAASIFEPERYNERLAWAKTTVLLETITSIFTKSQFSNVDMQAFVDEFINAQQHGKNQIPWHNVMDAVHETLNQISADVLTAHGVDIHPHLLCMWRTWLLSLQKGLDVAQGEAELIVQTINLYSGRWLPEKPLSYPQYQRLSLVTNNICHQLAHKENCITGFETQSNMQELVQLVYSHSPNDIDPDLKQTFLIVAKTYYYRAHFDHETVNGHIDKVLFKNVI